MIMMGGFIFQYQYCEYFAQDIVLFGKMWPWLNTVAMVLGYIQIVMFLLCLVIGLIMTVFIGSTVKETIVNTKRKVLRKLY